MTAKKGFLYGLTSGFVCYVSLIVLPRIGYTQVSVYSMYLFAALVIVALVLPIVSLYAGKEVLGTTIGGWIFGFTAFYQTAYVALTLYQGNLPHL